MLMTRNNKNNYAQELQLKEERINVWEKYNRVTVDRSNDHIKIKGWEFD